MDTRALPAFIDEHPTGVLIHMFDGTAYRVPHRDYVWFTPAYGSAESRAGRMATSFWLHDAELDQQKLVNALLVKEVTPLTRDGDSIQVRKGRRKRG